MHTHAHTHRYIHTHTLTHRCTHMRRKENKQVQLVFPTSGPNTCMVHLPRGKQLHTVQARIKPKIVWKYMRGQNNTAKQLCPNGLVRGKGGGGGGRESSLTITHTIKPGKHHPALNNAIWFTRTSRHLNHQISTTL